MKFLLKLKHWQLFLLTWGLPILANFFLLSQPELMFQVFPIMMLCFVVGIFGWIWAIATALNYKLPAEAKLNSDRFKIYFSVPILYILAVSLFMTFFASSLGSTGIAVMGSVFVVLHLLSMVFIFMGLRFAAKTIKSVELGRVAKFEDYAGEFFLIWFSIVGYWVLQPRLNKLVD